jgi:hypothetical protein
MLKAYPERIDWHLLSSNTASWAGELLCADTLERVHIPTLCANPAPFAGTIVEAAISEVCSGVNWRALARNPAPWVEELLRNRHPNLVDWAELSQNPALWVEALLKKNLQRYGHLMHLEKNPAPWAAEMQTTLAEHLNWTAVNEQLYAALLN